ncbi:hypothetical protein J2X97_001802 [Epilithonimonas hungarica]|uniref:hypothetical protein n=1 Tax=Epilithonimonas hungarica TaxID=454006 RepID=UPI00277D96BC|nr:hypothetical protein [Epilithonimonas hungarica]MDP9956165.1 hypothetical protein [Epilithonimonas hungarica]
MIEWNNFFGAILIDRDYENSKKYIEEELIMHNFYYFHPAIFSTGVKEIPFYYDYMLFTFGRTAKYFVCDNRELNNFIVEFEEILNNLDFLNAQVRIDTDYANYDLFWVNKNKLNATEKTEIINQFEEYKVKYFESENFYFGIGEIDLHTSWVETYNEEKIQEFESWYPNFKYPF